MSRVTHYTQNDKLLIDKGIKPLSKKERQALRKKWQDEVWEDMQICLERFNKYVMLRPTGFGKTYTCARATNLACCKDKKVLFVYQSEILKNTFAAYGKGSRPIIKDADNRIVYETYAMVGRHWGDIDYLENNLDLKNIGLIIFDECQYMGAETYRKALDVALTYMGHTVYKDRDDSSLVNGVSPKYCIPFIGATATIERADVDVCDKYFSVSDGEDVLYCWGEHIHSLDEAFEKGLLLPPEYQYISLEVDDSGESLLSKVRKTRASMLKDLKVQYSNGDKAVISNIQDLESCILKNADRIIHDTMLDLYMCDNVYSGDKDSFKSMEELNNFNAVEDWVLPKPENLPEYMRFLVFAPYRDILDQVRVSYSEGSNEELFEGLVKETVGFFESAFERYGYKVNALIVSSDSSEESNNVNFIDPDEKLKKAVMRRRKLESDEGLFVERKPMTIDLIFSINMLNIGYHVDSITGVVFRRWTGSNTIFYQQLGRCLSVDSDKIPVVFDFVNSISSRGINAPLYAVDKKTKAVTQIADGTTETNYKGKKHKRRLNEKVFNPETGTYVSPKRLNTIDAKYITISTQSATLPEIINRMRVFEIRKASTEIFDAAYNRYSNSYANINGKLTGSPNNMRPLYDSLRYFIDAAKATKSNMNKLNEIQTTINIKAFYEYLKRKGKKVYIEYSCLKNYLNMKENGTALVGMAHEINSLLLMSGKGKHDAELYLVVSNKDLSNYESDSKAKGALKGKLRDSQHIIVY